MSINNSINDSNNNDINVVSDKDVKYAELQFPYNVKGKKEGEVINKNCVVDENYCGETHLNLTNVGDCNVMICAGDKIVQGVVLPINYCQVEELGSVADLYAGSKSDRGAGCLGSTGTK